LYLLFVFTLLRFDIPELNPDLVSRVQDVSLVEQNMQRQQCSINGRNISSWGQDSLSMSELNLRVDGRGQSSVEAIAKHKFFGSKDNYAYATVKPSEVGLGAVSGDFDWNCSAGKSDLLANGIKMECSIARGLNEACEGPSVHVDGDRVASNFGNVVVYATRSSTELGSRGEVCSLSTTFEVHLDRNVAAGGVNKAKIN
jgi:hypothetical protein